VKVLPVQGNRSIKRIKTEIAISHASHAGVEHDHEQLDW
jgi:hypothetical protein